MGEPHTTVPAGTNEDLCLSSLLLLSEKYALHFWHVKDLRISAALIRASRVPVKQTTLKTILTHEVSRDTQTRGRSQGTTYLPGQFASQSCVMKEKRRFSRASKEGELLGLLCRQHNPPCSPSQEGASCRRRSREASD